MLLVHLMYFVTFGLFVDEYILDTERCNYINYVLLSKSQNKMKHDSYIWHMGRIGLSTLMSISLWQVTYYLVFFTQELMGGGEENLLTCYHRHWQQFSKGSTFLNQLYGQVFLIQQGLHLPQPTLWASILSSTGAPPSSTSSMGKYS